MKVILTCGHPHSGYRAAHEVLESAGLGVARASRREGFTPAALLEGVFKAGELDESLLATAEPLSPGRMWEEVAVDLFLGNLGNTSWGWADARTTWLLDFWKKLDERARFLLVYASPEFALGRMMRGGIRSVDEVLASWNAWHVELLRFYHRNRDRCLLVDIEAVHDAPEDFLRRVNEGFGVALRGLPPGYRAGAGVEARIASQLAKALAGVQPEAETLLQELESAADLPQPRKDAGGEAAWNEFSGLLVALDEARARAGAEAARAATEREARLKADLRASELEAKRAADSGIEALNAELLEENELLLVQLHQVQEDLERHYRKYEGALEMANLATRLAAGATGSEVDLRQDVDGENWYGPEANGRWAGPGEVSSLRIPALAEGEYELQLYVVECIAVDILPGLEVWFNGKRIDIHRTSEGAPSVLSARVASDAASRSPTWEFRFKFPRTVSPAGHGGSDTRSLAMKLRSLRISRAAAVTAAEVATQADTAKADTAFASRFWRDQQPAQFEIDMRREIDGSNWYAVEPDGRWAGPGVSSVIRIPALRDGKYELLLDIVGAMDADIVAGMDLAINGTRIEKNPAQPDQPLQVGARFSTEHIPAKPVWELQLKFPRLVSPAQHGSADTRTLAVRLRSIRLRDLVLETSESARPAPERSEATA